MNVTRLRQLIKRRGNAGVAVAGLHLAMHYVWSRHRRTVAVGVIVIAVLSLSVVRAPRDPRRATIVLKQTPPTTSISQPTSDGPSEQFETTAHVKLPYPHRSLIPRCRSVAGINEYFRDYAWLSPTGLMLVWSDHNDKSYTWEKYEKWTGRAEEVDTQTGSRRPLRGISRLLQHQNGVPLGFRLSPGRTWLEWTYICTGDCWPIPAAARVDGSGFQQWRQDKWSETGWLDDHRWVEVGSRSNYDEKDSSPVTVQDLIHESSTQVNGASRHGADIARRMRELNGGDINDGLGLDEPIEIDMNGAKVIATRREALQEISTKPVHINDVIVYRAHHSPRVFYAIQFVEALHLRIGRRYKTVEALYVSDANGLGAHEIGYVSSQQGKDTEDYTETTILTSVRWLPDDRHISFIYKKKLNVVKASR